MKVSLGVFVGGIVDIVATGILGLPLTIMTIMQVNVMALPPPQQTAAIVAFNHTHPMFFLGGLLVGCLGSIIGGYVAAWIANRSFVLCGLLSAWLCTLTGVWSLFSGANISAFEHVFGFVASFAFAALGGYLRLMRVNAKGSAVPA